MRSRLYAAVAVGLVLGLGGAGRTDDQVRATLDKAIKAHAGDVSPAKLLARQVKSKGKFYGLGDAIDVATEIATQLPDRTRVETEADFMGNKFKFMQVVDRDKGWVVRMDMTEEMDKDTLAEAKESLYAELVSSLVPLKGKEFQLTPAGESKVEGRDAIGIKVASKGHRDITLFFDKEKGMLVKRERKAKDIMTGTEFTEEVLFADYKRSPQGFQYPGKLTIKRDGTRYVETEIQEYKLVEKLDDKVLGKP